MTDKFAGAVPEHIDCVAIGFVVITVNGFTTTSETVDVAVPQVPVAIQ